MGVLNTTLDKNLNLFITRPKIAYCCQMGERTYPSIWHLKSLKTIIFIFLNPKNDDQTILKFYDDQAPYNLKQEKVIEFPTIYATFSHDCRSIIEQSSNKILFIGLNHPQGHIITKLQFEDDNSCKEEVIESEVNEERLFRCHTIENNRVLAFHNQHLIFYDADLKSLGKANWSREL